MTLKTLAQNSSEVSEALIDADAVPSLTQILATGTPAQRRHACILSSTLVKDSYRGAAVVVAAGAVPLLEELARNGTHRQKEVAVLALRGLRGPCEEINPKDKYRCMHCLESYKKWSQCRMHMHSCSKGARILLDPDAQNLCRLPSTEADTG